jgi:hypothetical protein
LRWRRKESVLRLPEEADLMEEANLAEDPDGGEEESEKR